MKSVLTALLLIAVLLFIAAEAKRQRGKGKPGERRQGLKKKPECPRNCSDCEEGICRECDEDFVLIYNRFNKTSCEPCGRKLKMRKPPLFLQHCVTECSKNCSSCGDNGNCKTCDDGFFKVQTRLLKRTICVPCSRKMKKNWPEVYEKECRLHGCGRNCTNCTMDGVCTECEGDLKLVTLSGTDFTKCVKKCPVFHKLVKGSSPARCEIKQGKKPAKTGKEPECNRVRVTVGKFSACRYRCPVPFSFNKAKYCERIGKSRKGGKMTMSADLP